ncbi:MAG: hypothetical protein ACI3Z8_02835 [Paludibacteraceae bacterium]
MKKLFSCVAAVLFAVSASAAVDTLTVDMLAATSTQYEDFSGVTATSDAVYAGTTSKSQAGAIQMNAKKKSGIVSTTSGGKVLTVSVVWNSETTDGRTVDVYGSNTPYKSAADLYATATKGTKLGSIVKGEKTTTVTIEGDYYYVSVRPYESALYLESVSIEWDGSEVPEPEPTPDPEPVVIDTLTCAAAATAALAGSSDSAVVIGYVTDIVSVWTEDKGYVSFWMADSVRGGQVFEAYHAVCKAAEDAPCVGDKVALKGVLGVYKSKTDTVPEMLAGCTYTILERSTVKPEEKGKVTIAEFLEAKDDFNIYTLTGTVSDLTNTEYGNFNLTDSTGTIFVFGLLTAEGVPGKFAELGIKEDDVITLKGSYTEHNGEPEIKNAIFVSKSSGETALEAVRSEEQAEKRVVNGQLVIIRNGVMYNAAGTRME